MSRLYIATKYENLQRAKTVATQLRSAGHTITYPWWESEQASTEQAVRDMRGVLEAEALVLIVETDLSYRGALVEFGIALGRGIPVFVMGNALDAKCIFMKLPHLHRGIQPLLARLS